MTVSGVWFNLVRCGDCDFVQGDVLDEQTGETIYRPIAVMVREAEIEDIAGLWPDITGHPVKGEEEACLVSYLSSRKGSEVELIIPERYRARPCAWNRFDETKEIRIYRDHIYPEIVNAIEAIEGTTVQQKTNLHPSCPAGTDEPAPRLPRRLLDMGCGCGDLIETCSMHIPDLECYGVDINADNIQAAKEKKNANIMEGDCEDLESVLPGDLRFDIIICCGLLNKQVISRDTAGIIFEKAAGRLQEGGHIIVTGYTACHLTAKDLSRMGIDVLRKSIPENLFKSYLEYHLRQFYVGRKR